MPVNLIITNAGRAALVNAGHDGTNAVQIVSVGLSPDALVPTPAVTALPGETKRLNGISGTGVTEYIIHLTVRDESADLYPVRSFALYLADGTLFAVYGQAELIVEKSAAAVLLLAIDVTLTDVSAAQISFGATDFLDPPASTERAGVVELATDAEATAMTDRQRALVPANLTAFLDVVLTAAAILAKLLAVDGSGSGLDADLLDGQHGSYYADIAARLGYTPLNAASYTAADVKAKLVTVDGAGSGIDADLLDGHDSSYFATAASATAAEVLARLLTVDGSGSGLDADLLDGHHASDFALASALIAAGRGFVDVIMPGNAITLTAAQSGYLLVISGSGTVTLPPPAKGLWYGLVARPPGSPQLVTDAPLLYYGDVAATPLALLPGTSALLFCDGTNWHLVAVSGMAPAPADADSSQKVPNTAWIRALLASYATRASPTLTGTPTAPTAAAGTNNNQIANTNFVAAAIAAVSGKWIAGSVAISGSTTLTAAQSGQLLNITPGPTITVTLPPPTAGLWYPFAVAFGNNAVSSLSLSTPSGLIYMFGSGAATQYLPPSASGVLYSDGSNWYGLATTGGSIFKNSITVNATNGTLTPAQYNSVVSLIGNVTLPGSYLTNGTFWLFNNSATASYTVTVADNIYYPSAGYNSRTITLLPGENVILMSPGGTGWNVIGGSWTSRVNTQTPAQFDNSTAPATSAFVQRALGNHQSHVLVSAATTLTAAQAGALVAFTASNVTATLPTVAGLAAGVTYRFYSPASTGCTVALNGGAFSNGAASLTLNAGDSVALEWGNNQWNLIGGSLADAGSAALATVISTTGSGLGIGQTWKSMAGSRSFNTTYTNTTGKTIVVAAETYWNNDNTNCRIEFRVDGFIVSEFFTNVNIQYGAINAIVPPGSTYMLYRSITSQTLMSWSELS